MKKSVQKRWAKLVTEGTSCQEMAAFFWNSDKSSDEDKYWLNLHLESFENMFQQKDEYNEIQTEMAIIHMTMRIDAIQMYARSHPDLKREYDYSLNKKDGYHKWLKCYISSDPATELHIIRDRKALKKFLKLEEQNQRGRV